MPREGSIFSLLETYSGFNRVIYRRVVLFEHLWIIRRMMRFSERTGDKWQQPIAKSIAITTCILRAIYEYYFWESLRRESRPNND